MQYGTSRNPDADPRLAELFLEEIKASHRHSRGCFLLVRMQIILYTVLGSVERKSF